MYSPHSPTLSSGGNFGDHNHHHSFVSANNNNSSHLHQHHSPAANSSDYHNQYHLNDYHRHQYSVSPSSYATTTRSSSHNNHQPNIGAHFANNVTSSSSAAAAAAAAAVAASVSASSSSKSSSSIKCLKFKYFTTFFICTTCLALLSASLATHKWLISKPLRILRLNNGQTTNFTALMLTAAQDTAADQDDANLANRRRHYQSTTSASLHKAANQQQQQPQQLLQQSSDLFVVPATSAANSIGSAAVQVVAGQNSKFQGEIYFGLFNGVKVLNYGFGDRVSQLSVLQAYYSKGNAGDNPQSNQHELVNFKFWLATIIGVALAILFALIGSIFAIINFVMTPRGTITGPVGLVIWNAAACFSCLLAMFAWLVEYFLRLKTNVLTPEEVQNGWTSENRSQFGYSYYFVVLAFMLHLVNIFIVSIVQTETWTNKAAAKRQSRTSACEGVIMLY